MICWPSNVPLAKCSRMNLAMSLTELLSPPAGASASASRTFFASHFLSPAGPTGTLISALLVRASKSACR